MLLILFLSMLLSLFANIESKSYFHIGKNYDDAQVLLQDEIKNLHTGLLEVPMIEFVYDIKDPITRIEIMSEENVSAEVNFSYYNTVINGSVTTMSTSIESEQKPFEISVTIYGYKGPLPVTFIAQLVRPKQYIGSLKPSPEPGVVDHMEIADEFNSVQEVENENEHSSPEPSEQFEEESDLDQNDNNDSDNDDVEEDDVDRIEDNETFESADKFISVGRRQSGDSLLYETYQNSVTVTESPTKHFVIFYYIDSAFITYIEFVIFDYKNYKTEKEIRDGHVIEYSHFTPNTLKATVIDYKTTSLFAKMSIYGYNKSDLPQNYVSYVPKKVLDQENGYTTESPMHLRAKINAMQDYDELPQKEELHYAVTKLAGNQPGGAKSLQSSKLLFLLSFVAAVCRLRTLVIH